MMLEIIEYLKGERVMRKLMKQLINMPIRKLEYIIRIPSYVQGIWDTLACYKIPHTKENHEILVELVQTKLNGPDIEREWSEEEYNSFVLYKE
jgi:hypothetical protein